MHQGLRDEIQRIIIITIVALLVGLLSGQLVQSLLAAGLLYSCWLLNQTRNFYLWLAGNMASPPPDSSGIWGDIFEGMYRMRQANIRTQQEMQREIDRFTQFTRALQSGIVLLGPQGNIHWWNESAEKLLGFKRDFDVGKPLLNLIRDPLFRAYFNGGSYQDVVTITSPLNSGVFLELQITVYGKSERLLAVQDVTRLKQVELVRKEFVANVSHELRTPLTVINGYLESMVESIDQFDESWWQPIASIHAQSQRMSNIVKDLATLSRLDNSDLTDRNDLIPVAPLLEQVVADARQLCSGESVEIRLRGEPFALLGSETELQSCFSNLVLNATKYGKPGGVLVQIDYWVDQEGGHVAVKDDGIGIDPVHIPRLTERFYRVDSSHSRRTGGTGLGLAIVKHVLSRHGSRLSIDSSRGKGSTFSCHFPSQRLG